jgi:TRAP-type uncharacterized transport system fused permease subunit
MFAFYFGIIADLTPPVALAAFAGAAIAKANPFKTGVIATKLAIAAFLVPYIFVYNPALLLIKTNPVEIIQMILTAIIGMIGIGAAVEGWYWTHMSWWERIASFAGGLLLIDPGTLTDIIGVCILGLITAIQYPKWRAARSLTLVKGASKESLAVDP